MEKNYLTSIKKYLDNLEALQPIETNIESNINPNLKVKAIIFDIYGTLLVSASGDIDQAQVKTDYLDLALSESGYTLLSDNKEAVLSEILSDFKQEVRNIHTSAKQQGTKYPEIKIDNVWQQVLSKYIDNKIIKTEIHANIKLLTLIFELHSNRVWPMPDMKKVISELKNKGIILGIISNAQFYTPLVMNYFLTNEITEKEEIAYFEENLSVYSYKECVAKPSDILYNKLIDKLERIYNISKEETIFVGNDMLNDIFGAHQTGMKTALYAGDKRSLRMREDKAECKNLKPDIIIKNLNELFEII